MKRFLIVFASLLFINAFSQDVADLTIDSLLLKAKAFYKTNQDSAIYFSDLAYNKAKELNNDQLIGKTITLKSTYLLSKKKYDEVKDLLEFNIQNKKNIDRLDLGITYATLGSVYFLKEERDESIINYLTAIDIFEELENHEYLSRNYLNLGVIYEREEKQEQADYFYDKSLEAAKKFRGEISETTHEDIKREEASKSYEKKLEISLNVLNSIEEKDKSRLAAVIYHDLSKIYFGAEKYLQAITAAQKSIKIKNAIGYDQNIDFSYYVIGASQVNLNNNDEGIKNLNKAISASEKRELITKIYKTLIRAYENKKDFKNAYLNSEILSQIKDSINTFQENERIAEITSKYQTEKQANEILKLEKANKENELQLSIQKRKRWQWATLSILFLICSLFLGRYLVAYIKKVKIVELEKETIKKKVEAKFIALNNKSKVYIKDLEYIKSDGNYLEFYSADKKTIDRNKLKNIKEQLPPNFVQIHRSFIINKNAIQSVTATSLTLKNGIQIPISRTFKQNLS